MSNTTTTAAKATKGSKALAAFKAKLPEGVTLNDVVSSLLADKELLKSPEMKEAFKESGVKVTAKGPSENVEELKAAVVKYAAEVGLGENAHIGKIKQLTVQTKGTSESIYCLFEVGGSAKSCSVRRFVPHKENGGAGSAKLAKVVAIVKKAVLQTALAAAELQSSVNDDIVEALK